MDEVREGRVRVAANQDIIAVVIAQVKNVDVLFLELLSDGSQLLGVMVTDYHAWAIIVFAGFDQANNALAVWAPS